MKPARHQYGFTLIELLIALALLALLSITAYRGLDSVLQTRDQLATETRKWQQRAAFFSRMEQDIAQAIHRPVRGRNGETLPEWIGLPAQASDDNGALTFTRAGIPDQGQAMLAPQRIGYGLRQNTLVLLRWPYPDQAPNAEPLVYPLLEGVSEFELRYMDAEGNWFEQWPPAGQVDVLPRAAEVKMTFVSGEVITRVFALQ
ncbi:MAG: type II secretion system minor pseudopilin GspJ [Gallionellaceae bacterium]|jgi:general secretion pathway protein J|nr:type II secretion system minor pseudopilin GspJ [Gallionellaceae bacterium]